MNFYSEILKFETTRVVHFHYVVLFVVFVFVKIVNYKIEPTCQTHGRTRIFNLCFSDHSHANFGKQAESEIRTSC